MEPTTGSGNGGAERGRKGPDCRAAQAGVDVGAAGTRKLDGRREVRGAEQGNYSSERRRGPRGGPDSVALVQPGLHDPHGRRPMGFEHTPEWPGVPVHKEMLVNVSLERRSARERLRDKAAGMSALRFNDPSVRAKRLLEVES